MGDDTIKNNGVSISYFDCSVENFSAFIDSIKKLCVLPGDESFDASEIERFSSMITFLKEWRYFVYEPKTINFTHEIGVGKVKDDSDGITLPQFSSASVPKMKNSPEEAICFGSDFVLHAGGLVWALDWCPRNQECPRNQVKPDNSIKCEYLAVSAHPPGSTHHKIGVPLFGRGIIQIWCLLSLEENMEDSPQDQNRQRGKHNGSFKSRPAHSLEKKEETVRKPRGRPKGTYKRQLSANENDLNDKMESDSPANTLVLGTSSMVSLDGLKGKEEPVRKGRGRPKGSGKKKQCNTENSLNNKMERNSPADNLVLSMNGLVPLSSEDLDLGGELAPSYGVRGNEESSIQRPRGRPKGNGKKQQCGSENNINDKMDWNSLGDNLVLSKNDLVPLSGEDLDLGGEVVGKEELSIRKPRGRPKGNGKNQICENNLNYKMESDSYGNNSILSTSILVPLTSDGLGRSELVPSYGLEGRVELPIQRRRGRPKGSGKKKQCTDESNSNDKMESDSYGNNFISTRTTSNKEPTPSPNECTPTSLSVVASTVSTDLNGNLETFSLKDRWRSRKKPIPNANECDHASGFDLRAHVAGLPASRFGTMGDCIERRANSPVLNGERDSSLLSSAREFEHEELTLATTPINDDHCQGEIVLSKEISERKFYVPEDSALPKVVLCLAHMGKVAWDVKWRPASANNSEDKHHLGYLAVLLGNGSLEVWEVPVPNMLKVLHTSFGSEGTDPRFLKLEPIFKCSKVQCGDRQSIPLTLEWSPSAPHDLILTGCHDGTVALWKFSKQHPSQDIKPLLCFSADCVPIRALAWAPEESDAESVNLIVTAGHEGLKFWDIRDPFRPLCELCPGSVILSLQWLKDPRCIIMSLDDGELRMLSLWKVANNFLVTGELPGPSKQTGSFYCCSHSAIWSCQVSRANGVTAYCTADGSARHFKLTANAVEKDPSRYREPHFLCGSFSSDEKSFRINSPLSNDPLPNVPWKKMLTGLGDAPLAIFLSNQRGGGDDQTPPVMKSKSTLRYNKKKSCSKISDPSKQSCPASAIEADEGTLQIIDGTDEGCAQRIEGLPPKDVAIHKIRWNMNKGSERWLCYGGAAGIVRCQKIYSGALQ